MGLVQGPVGRTEEALADGDANRISEMFALTIDTPSATPTSWATRPAHTQPAMTRHAIRAAYTKPALPEGGARAAVSKPLETCKGAGYGVECA